MKKYMPNILIGLLVVIGLGLLYLTNMGVVSFDKPYIYQLSKDLPTSNPPVAFINVNVIPMDSEQILEDQTVIVRDGLIETVGDSQEVAIPDDALVVDGRGKYLMPGLVDMHVHIEYENDMLLLVANGVTSVTQYVGQYR